jgi:hypothetical protein
MKNFCVIVPLHKLPFLQKFKHIENYQNGKDVLFLKSDFFLS